MDYYKAKTGNNSKLRVTNKYCTLFVQKENIFVERENKLNKLFQLGGWVTHTQKDPELLYN